MKKNQFFATAFLLIIALFCNNRLSSQNQHVNGALRVEAGVSVGGGHNFEVDAPGIVGGRFKIATDGKVGIGTNTPTAPLQFGNVLGNKIILYDVRGRIQRGFGFGINDGNLSAFIPDGGGHRFSIRTNSFDGAEKFVVTQEGKVGIGTSTPGAPLQVVTATSNYGIVHSDGVVSLSTHIGGGGGGIGTLTNHPLYFYTNGTNAQLSISADGRVGIGTTTPTAPLQFGNVLGNKITLYDDSANGNMGFGFGINGANLSAYIPDLPGQRFSIRTNSYDGTERFIVEKDGAIGAGSRIYPGMTGSEGGYSFVHFKNGTGASGGIIRSSIGVTDAGDAPLRTESGYIDFFTAGANRMSITNAGNVGIGTANPTYKLSVNGTIQAKEIRVETGWADFVFDENYQLRPLAEVEKYIRRHKHLPDVTPAADIQKDGLQVGKQMTEMMQKIEELTLYVIDLQKENTRSREENAELKKRLQKLEKQ